jgi:hypothetical protein
LALSRQETKDVIAVLSDNVPGAPAWRLCLEHFSTKAGVRPERNGDVAELVRQVAAQHGATAQEGGPCDHDHHADGLIIVGPIHPLAS